eukprot:CAMPEP_0177631496 /NCGR_PEP_ID=MMETSP0447-20121125/1781_1 /TAXON_ID=0 /ORGANISM="Stygamoeba regulata, Strain BSH-02190019" /LENGTH=479 /DNA_ID=CAMNT_0019132985 /DNA_START=127 /DNA_END=1567 /DNA_ORIENTATION=+
MADWMKKKRGGSSSLAKLRAKSGTIGNLLESFYGFQHGRLICQVIRTNFPEKNGYCVLSIEKKKFRTTVFNTEGLFNQEFCFDIEQSTGVLCLVLKQHHRRSKNRRIASVDIPLKQFVDGMVHERWFQLTYKEKQKGPEECCRAYSGTDPPDLAVVSALCAARDSDTLSNTLIRFFYTHKKAIELIVGLVRRQLVVTDEEQDTTLFRTDGMATKTVRNYFSMIAKHYVSDCLQESVAKIIAQPTGYEVDPVRLGDGENVEENIFRLRATAQQILDKVLESLPQVPKSVRLTLYRVSQLVSELHPGHERRVTGSFLFLRFICPSLFHPSNAGLITEDVKLSADARRALILVVKLIQQLANDVKTAKEEHMAPLNDFYESNIERFNEFLDKVATLPAEGEEVGADLQRAGIPEEDLWRYLALIIGQMTKVLPRMKEKYAEDSVLTSESRAVNDEAFVMLEKILISRMQCDETDDGRSPRDI